MVKSLRIALALTLAAVARSGFAEGDAADEPANAIFFREPDEETATRISTLVSRLATVAVSDRTKARRELELIGWWTVEPLLSAAQTLEPPIRCASILTLDAIHDRRAMEPLRGVVAKETSHPYVAAFATLALGRFRDPASVDTLRTASRTTKSMDMLKAAVPFACAKIRTSEARELVLECARRSGAKEPVRSAALLALGFFPDVALDARGKPGAELASGLESKRRGDRQAALLGYLVASNGRRDGKSFLLDFFAGESAPEVAAIALLGLARFPDADVTEFLAKAAARQSDDVVRDTAADLLFDRVDAAVKPLVLATSRNATSTRVRAACVLALGRVDDDEVQASLLEKLKDHAPLVRTAAAVALTRSPRAATRSAGLAAIEQRLHRGETSDDVRADLEKARAVLAGERTDVRFTEVGAELLFGDMGLSYPQRLLRAVNQRVQISLDLGKIHNLQTDQELTSGVPPLEPNDGGGGLPGGGSGGGSGGGGGDGGDGGSSPADPAPEPQVVGAQRTSQWQELRDLKVELVRNPYFVPTDLPAGTTTPSK